MQKDNEHQIAVKHNINKKVIEVTIDGIINIFTSKQAKRLAHLLNVNASALDICVYKNKGGALYEKIRKEGSA